jgi:phenylacetate-CoA ligase
MSHRELRGHLERIEKFGPEFIYGYSSAVYRLALYYSEHTLPPPPGLRAIFFTAGDLPGFQRRLVEETLRAPATREYGSSETGAFAFQCREGGLHVAAENIYLEILRQGRPVPPGEEGDLVATVLHNRAMPLIRFNLGDRARRIPGRCACGRYLPRIELLEENEKEPAGGPMSGEWWGSLCDHILFELIDRRMGGIRQFQVIQKSKNRFVVQIVPGQEFGPDCLDLFERRMRERLGMEVVLEYEIVPEIPGESEGMIYHFRSEIPRPGREEPGS